MDLVFLHGLEVETVIGIFDWERKALQKVIIDLDMSTDVRKAAATDNIEDTLDYKAVSKRVVSYVQASHFQLVETLAEQIAQLVQEEFDVQWVRVRINKKGAISGAADVGIIIERGDLVDG